MSHNTRSDELGNPETASRFWRKVERGPHCWLWRGSLKGSKRPREFRYGQFSTTVNGVTRPTGAHVAAYALTYGGVPPGLSVLHHCDTPACVRPDHLFLGTHQDNMADAARKGRLHVSRPNRQQIPSSTISEIRQRVEAGERRSHIAADYGISKALVTLVMQGKRRPCGLRVST